MDDVGREINLGAEVCSRIKTVRYPKTSWVDAHDLIVKDFNTVKNKARIFYPGKQTLDVLIQVRTWSDDDFNDALE